MDEYPIKTLLFVQELYGSRELYTWPWLAKSLKVHSYHDWQCSSEMLEALLSPEVVLQRYQGEKSANYVMYVALSLGFIINSRREC